MEESMDQPAHGVVEMIGFAAGHMQTMGATIFAKNAAVKEVLSGIWLNAGK
jgi:hypothetical protein